MTSKVIEARLWRNIYPYTIFTEEGFANLAKQMIEKPITIGGFTVGWIIEATVEGDYIRYKFKLEGDETNVD